MLGTMEEARAEMCAGTKGKAFSMVYFVRVVMLDMLKAVYTMLFSENGLNKTVFYSLRKLETEVVSMTASLIGSDAKVRGQHDDKEARTA